jgi:replicative DNA helicase
VLVKLYEQNRPIDAVILREELIKRQLLEAIGGCAVPGADPQLRPSSAHGAHYAGIVREKALLRPAHRRQQRHRCRDAYAPHEQAELGARQGGEKESSRSPEKVGKAMVRWRTCCTKSSR